MAFFARNVGVDVAPGSGIVPIYTTRFFQKAPVMPITANLIGLYVPQVSNAMSLRNYAGGAALTVVGSPVCNTSGIGAVCSKNNCFNTGLLSQARQTLISIAKLVQSPNSSGNCTMIGNYSGGSPAGDDLGFSSVNNARSISGRSATGNDAASVTVAAETAGAPIFAAASMQYTSGVGGVVTIHKAQAGVFTTGTPDTSVSPRIPITNTNTIRIGGNYVASGADGTIEVLFAAIYSEVLTEAEITATYTYLRTYMLAFGVPV